MSYFWSHFRFLKILCAVLFKFSVNFNIFWHLSADLFFSTLPQRHPLLRGFWRLFIFSFSDDFHFLYFRCVEIYLMERLEKGYGQCTYHLTKMKVEYTSWYCFWTGHNGETHFRNMQEIYQKQICIPWRSRVTT